MDNNESTAMLRAVFGFSLFDPAGQPNIVIDSPLEHELIWTLVNNAADDGQDLLITPFASGSVSATQYHFMLHFVPGALTDTPAVAGWQVAVDRDSSGAIQSLYIASTVPISIPPTAAHGSSLSYTQAVQHHSDSKVAVSLTAGKSVSLAGTAIEGKNFGPIDLNLVSSAKVSTPPISVDFVGRRTVLNDGVTPNRFTFALTNMATVDLQLTPDSGAFAAPTVFTVWFDAAPNDPQQPYAWALAQVQDLDASSVALTVPSDDWREAKTIDAAATVVPGNPQWSITLTKAFTLAPQAPVLFTFSGIKTDLDPGFTRMYLMFENLPGFQTGILICGLEKTPLLYGAQRGEGLYLSAGKPQGDVPPVLNYDNGLYLQQFDDGQPAATFHGGTGVAIQPASGSRLAAQIQGRVQVSDDLSVDGSLSANGLDVKAAGSATISLAATGGGVLKIGSEADKKDQIIFEGLSSDEAGSAQQMVLTGRFEEALPYLGLVAETTEVSGDLQIKGDAAVIGKLSAQGPVSMFGGYQRREYSKTYTAATDGFVVAVAECPYGGTLVGYVNDSLVAKSQQKNCFSMQVNADVLISVNLGTVANTVSFPVGNGSSWRVELETGSMQPSPTIYVNWVPIGSAQTSMTEVAQTGVAQRSNVAQTDEGDAKESVAELDDDPAGVSGQELSQEAKQ